MNQRTLHTVSQVARLTHLTVRALHHYDQIGLVRPSQRSAAGYRLYDADDLRRLRQVLVYRELGFGLDAVRQLIDASPAQQRAALLSQRDAIERQRRHTEALLRAVDATLDHLQEQSPMTTEHLFDGFEQFTHGEYAREAQQRWGDTDAWQQSRERTARYTRDDWAQAQAEQQALIGELLGLQQGGHAPDSAAAMALAERHRLQIDQRYYACDYAIHCGLADMYESDERFRDYHERQGEGLAAYLVAAIRANAAARR